MLHSNTFVSNETGPQLNLWFLVLLWFDTMVMCFGCCKKLLNYVRKEADKRFVVEFIFMGDNHELGWPETRLGFNFLQVFTAALACTKEIKNLKRSFQFTVFVLNVKRFKPLFCTFGTCHWGRCENVWFCQFLPFFAPWNQVDPEAGSYLHKV